MREVAAAVGLAEGEPGVRSVIAALARLEPVSIRRISRTVELPVPIVASVCGELRKRSVVAEERPAQLTPAGRDLYAAGRLAIGPAATCPTCGGRGTVVAGELTGVAAEVARAAKKAPPPRLELDQCHCTVGTKLRRVLAMHEADALVGRRILLLGDDDLTSLAIRSVVRGFGSEATIANLSVVDVDPALVAFLRKELSGTPFPSSCTQHDLREPLASDFRGVFDTVVTDPPYTVAAAHPPAVVLAPEPVDRGRPPRHARARGRRLHLLLAARAGAAHRQVPRRDPRGVAREPQRLALAGPAERADARQDPVPERDRRAARAVARADGAGLGPA